MPTLAPKPKDGGVTAEDVDQKLARGVFVKRGDIMKAFGLTRSDMDALVPETFRPADCAKFKRHRFVRSQVMAIARQWERRA